MTLQDRARAVSDRISTRYGGAAVLSRTTTTGGGPSDPTGGTTTTETHNVQFVEAKAETEFYTAGLILQSDLTGIMQPIEAITPQPGDVLTVRGKAHNVLHAAAVRSDPTGPVVHFAIHARA